MGKAVNKLSNREYINHLYKDNADGYIQVMQLKNNGVINIKNYKGLSIEKAISKYTGSTDTFITPNLTYNGKRQINNIRQFRALYIDLDHDYYTFNDLVYNTWDLVNEGKIPCPTMVISSGRGAHLYWRIEHAPYQALATWQELEDYLCYQLKKLGADKKATDATRILRLPDTLNSRNNKECKVMLINNNIYSMYDLREKYLKWKPKIFKVVEVDGKVYSKVNNSKVIQFFTSYTLHMAREEDILTICKLRGFNVTGYRNMILHCYAYWLGVTHRKLNELSDEVNKLNNRFTEPLKQNEVDAILRCVPKAIEKFINYEQGLRSGEVKRVSKGMRDKGGYWYKNETLIDRLDITLDEQRHLKTIISAKEKYRRNADTKKEKQRAARRNTKGLTKRQQEKEVLINKVKELKLQGFTQKQASEILNKSIRTIKNYWNI